jgi:serine/threonine protein phosphatase 1
MLTRLLRSREDVTRPASTPDDTAIYAVGDIHGRLDLLGKVHGLIAAHAKTVARPRKVIVYLGDLVDRGPNSREVVEHLITSPLPGFEYVYLKGNHEDAMLRFLDDIGIGRAWLGFCGEATLMSYGLDLYAKPPEGMSWLEHLQAELRRRLPDDHLRFLQDLELSHTEGGYFFVHAGVKPGVPLHVQEDQDLMWIREEFLDSREAFDKVVIHGHSITNRPDFRANRIGIDTGAVFTGVLTCLALVGEERQILQTG